MNLLYKFIIICYKGEDCGRVVVWNMSPVKNEESELDENVPKLLCQMDNHLGKLVINYYSMVIR